MFIHVKHFVVLPYSYHHYLVALGYVREQSQDNDEADVSLKVLEFGLYTFCSM
jgi:hypothetical protein